MGRDHPFEQKEPLLRGLKNRIFQLLAQFGPGATGLRILLHKLRGVKIGQNVWIGYDVVLETARPEWITIGDNVTIQMRTTIIAHFQETKFVEIEDDVYIGPRVIILPNVKIGKGAVITAGSVVSRSVPAMTVVRGNPAVPIAKCSVPLAYTTSVKKFSQGLRPIKRRTPQTG